MTTNVTLHAGHDVGYFTRGQGAGGCAGAMSYYTAAGEPPGQWTGKAAAGLGLTGQVDPGVIERLFMKGIGPGGELLVSRRQSKDASEREQAAVAAYMSEHPYASPVEVAEVRAAERGKDPHTVPYFDLTISAAKSISVLHASYRVSARQARDRGDEVQGAGLDAKADAIENALMESAREAVGWLERNATYTRTGHHSASTGEWRDGAGLVASLFVHHISRDGDPQLHVHVAMWNRVQRADGADEKWRTLDSRTLHNQRLGVAALTDKIMETKLTGLGYVMVPRLDGNGAEIGGVSQDVMDLLSSRSVAITGELKRLAAEYQAAHGVAPSPRTMWLLHQQAGQNTRRSKKQARRTVAGRTGSEEPTEAERFAAWEEQTAQQEIRALSQVHGQVSEYVADNAGRGHAPLNYAAKRRIARIAVAEVQEHHAVWTMSQLWFEIRAALPILPAGADVNALISEIATLATTGRAGTCVVQVTAPDVTDVTGLGTRASDGGSVYRPPQEDRYSTLEHLDTEEQILAAAGQAIGQAVTEAAARAAVAAAGLTAEQGEAVVRMLTAPTVAAVLVAPAGAGKSHTMAAFAGLWELLTGGRVIGLATSTNAARVLQNEGLAESYNIAEFLGKIEGSDELRHPVPVRAGDVLVVDEATQASTADLAMVFEAARAAGARVRPVGDTQQLGSPEAGGMFRLLAQEVPAAELTEVRRFTGQWEAAASVRLRAGETGVIAVYDRHGRIRAADHEAAYEKAAAAWFTDHLDGKDVLLLAGSNEEAADLARRVQAKLIQAGHVSAGGYQAHLPLADGNQARPGDLIRARLNTEIDADGQRLTNRDTLKITAIRGDDVEVRRQRPDRTWTAKFWVPRAYLAASAELGYAGNVHVAQGRTVDTAHLLVTGTLSRQSLYVGMSRGRDGNTAHVVTGDTAAPGKEPYQQAAPEAVLKNVMERDGDEVSATEAIRQSQQWASGTGHLLNLWNHAAQPAIRDYVDRQITAVLDETQARRYQLEHARHALHAALRTAHLAGYDLATVIDRITAAPLDGARSITAVLHGRLQHLDLPAPAQPATWAQRTLASAPQVAHEIAGALDHHTEEIGRRHADQPQPWLADRIGVLDPHASPALTADYIRRAGIAGAYREAAGITNPNQAISAEPHHGNPELEHMRQQVIRELEIADQQALLHAMGRDQLETLVNQAERAQAAAPPDVSDQLRATVHAEADARQQAADARAEGNHERAREADQLARQLGDERQNLEPQNAEHEHWAATSRDDRDLGAKASAELQRRDHTQPQPDQPDIEPAGAADSRPPDGNPETAAETQSPHANDTLQGDDTSRTRQHETAPDAGQLESQPQSGTTADVTQPGPDHDPGPTDVPIDEVHATAVNAARQYGEERVLQQAWRVYAARIAARQAETQPEARAEPYASREHEAPGGHEIEL